MTIVDRLFRLWTEPLGEPAEALAAFGRAYTDPVRVNGADMALADLVERARGLQRAFADLRVELVEQVEAPGRLVIVFVQRGRHVGPFETALGVVDATGREFAVRTIDVLTLEDGRISSVEVVADNLALAMQLEAVRFSGEGG